MNQVSTRLSQILHDAVIGLRAEFILLLFFILLLLLDLFLKPSKKNELLVFVSFIGVFISLFFNLLDFVNPLNLRLLNDFLISSSPISMVKMAMGIATLLTLVIHSQNKNQKGETYLLLMAAYLGLSFAVMSANWLALILSLEIASLSFYVLVGIENNLKSTEASLKYVIFGLLSSAIMIYGISLLYGTTGTIYFTAPDFGKKMVMANSILPFLGLIFTSFGLLFKLGVFPLHIWLPDTYNGASWSVISILSTLPKLAAGAILLFFWNKFSLFPFQLFQHEVFWNHFLVLVSIASLVIGSFSAISQENIKRFIAYSSISNMGFVLIGIISNSNPGAKATLYYLFAYSLITMGLVFVFYLVNINTFSDLKGLASKSKLYALLITVLIMALAGIPPSVGFTSKLLIFTSLLEAYSHIKINSASLANAYLALLIFASISTIIGFYYYLRLPYLMYLKNAENKDFVIPKSISMSLIAIIISILVIGLFFINIIN